MMKGIGGYFELELENRGSFIHDDGLLVNTGRNALELILRHLPVRSRIFMPKYTCDVVLEPFLKLNLSYTFYSINSYLELSENLQLSKNDYLLYTNYFGIKDSYVRELANRYPGKLIVDNAQALYMEPTEMSFYSPRKFVGLPDGGIAYFPDNISLELYDYDYSYDRCSHLLKRLDLGAEAGYSDFKLNASSLRNQPIKQMSRLTKALLHSIDFEGIRQSRINNFKVFQEALGNKNLLKIDDISELACPMVYPFMTDDVTLRQRLIDNKIFVATYWQNMSKWCDPESTEFKLSKTIIPLPLDQRYGRKDIETILKLI